jgi:uncharacterized membrane protein (UPF0127 family)
LLEKTIAFGGRPSKLIEPMMYLTVRNATRNVELGRKVRFAASLMDRAVGLLLTPHLDAGEGMYLAPCKSVHTIFMRYPIDVLFLDAEGTVLSQNTLQPWRVSGWQAQSRGVLELMEGTLTRTGTRVGDRIELEGLN